MTVFISERVYCNYCFLRDYFVTTSDTSFFVELKFKQCECIRNNLNLQKINFFFSRLHVFQIKLKVLISNMLIQFACNVNGAWNLF
jgi:hypothetical protein